MYQTKEKSENDIWMEDKTDVELPFFDLSTMLDATNKFSTDNKLGEGGFGPVYKVYINLPFNRVKVNLSFKN